VDRIEHFYSYAMGGAASAYAAHRTGFARSLYFVMKRGSLRARSFTDVKMPRASRSRFNLAKQSSTWFSHEA
jgi:hypothetical protein